jgi:hypothetical protein
VETPGVMIRRFSEFTWDFLVYSVLDFQPVLVAVDVLFLLSGPLQNWRLKRQLKLLSDGELVLRSGDCKKAILGFCGVSNGAGQLRLFYRQENGDQRKILVTLFDFVVATSCRLGSFVTRALVVLAA